FSGPTSVSVDACSLACAGGACVPQSGATCSLLDGLGPCAMYRLAYRNYGSHQSLVFDHNVTAGSAVGLRWYEIRDPNGAPFVFQQGTYAPDSAYRWVGSIAMDKSEDMAM